MRRAFVESLDKLMEKDKNIFLLTLDVGFGVLEKCAEKFPNNFINVGLRETNAVSMATGMALKGKIPFVYSINSFLVFKTLEQTRMLANMEQHVVLVGTGLDEEYTNFGITHYSYGDEEVLKIMPIKILTPKNKEEVDANIKEAYHGTGPYYIRLSRF